MKKTLAVLCLLVCPAFASAQTITSIGLSPVTSGNDFATKAFQDPWDMNERTDLGWFLHGTDAPTPGFTQPPAFSGGVFTGVTNTGDPSFFLLETGNPNASRLGKIGLNHPIDANTYRYLAFRMSVTTADFTQFVWNRETIYDDTTTLAFNVSTTPGFRIYLVDLASLEKLNIGAKAFFWGGTVKSLRMDPTERSGETVQLDWVRLVNAGTLSSCRTITWSGGGNVDLYVANTAGTSLGKIASNVAANQASPGCTAVAGGYTYYAGALAPGTYRVGISAVGGTVPASTTASTVTWVVNDIPTLAFTSPDPEGSSDDFATTILSNPWDMNALSDLDLITNVTSSRITTVALETPAGTSLGSPQVFYGTSVSAAASGSIVGDPYVDPLFVTRRGFNNRIDTSRYRILTLEMGIPALARNILDGSIARIVWRIAGEAAENVSDDIIFNHRVGANVLDKIIVDMADRTALPLEPGVTSGWTNGVSSKPGLDIFRVDPHEFSNPTDFYIRRIKLAAFEKAAASYTIRWTYADTQPGTVSLYHHTTNTAACTAGMLIGSPVTASVGQATWTVSAEADGTYYLCASFTDGPNTNETFAKWPIIVQHSFTTGPRLVLNRQNLNFGVVQRPNATFPLIGTSAQTIRVSVAGSGTPCWTVDNGLPATYTVALSGGGTHVCGAGSFTIGLNPTNPFNITGVGEATFTVRDVTPGTTSNTPQYVHSFHRIVATTNAPGGLVDTPATGTTVSGSIAVTGWATDDIDIATIGVFRDPVAGEGTAPVFVGNAVRVDDARPDIEAGNPDAPYNYRGGWGYLLLTNFLPGGGDGTYTLRIFATDVEGKQTLLGSPVIVGANSIATRPFGAIDTPAQGEVISGTSYNNFGWVLVRGPANASPDLSPPGTVSVVIDGLSVGIPCCWGSRSDLDALFPASTFPGISKALGVYTFNPSALANGVHTIAWVVTASNGQADGIGSRYFTVTGGTSSLTLSARAGVMTAPQRLDAGPDLGRRASAVGAIAASGPRTVLGEQLGRVVVDGSRPGTTRYDAYLVANGRLSPLPIGASFDDRAGIVYWQPGVGYTGAYDFVVVRDGRERVPVRVVLQPQRVRTPVRRGFDIKFATEPAVVSAAGLR